ncbi:hypothetical protein LCGC14_2895460 [marine sediment metagenome]|uniref:Uncharacterized protein n=1 Tax=marine sediment metagenome TaxID=412755 RepID=A0A0F9AM49_9ZZZZ
MPTATINKTVSIAGLSFTGQTQRTEAGQIGHQLSLAAAVGGEVSDELTTRTNDTDGVITLGAGHGFSTADIVDIYWTDASGVDQVRYGSVLSADDANTITTSLGAGTVLPSLNTTGMIVCEQTIIDSDFDGDLMEMIVSQCTTRGHLDFQDVGNATLVAVELTANEVWEWASNTGVANPLTGNPVDDIKVSNGSVTSTGTLRIGVLYDSDG